MGVPEELTRQEEHPELYKGLSLVQHTVQKGVTEVPEAFIQPPHMRSSASILDTNLQIPMSDMALLQKGEKAKKQVQADITRASEDGGFFGIPYDHIALSNTVSGGLTGASSTFIAFTGGSHWKWCSSDVPVT